MKTLDRHRGIYEARRGSNRCPVCGWRFRVDNDWDLDELFCSRCETRLLYNDDGNYGRWIDAGMYSESMR